MTYRGCSLQSADLIHAVFIVNMSQISPYQFEPEYSSSEEQPQSAAEEEEGEEEDSVSNEGNENRRSNTSWCSCERCVSMPSEKECVCCKELTFLSKIVEGTLQCICKEVIDAFFFRKAVFLKLFLYKQMRW